MPAELTIGILSLQGAFDLHAQVLEQISRQDDQTEIQVKNVRRPEHLTNLDGIILPGGESTVMEKLLKSSGLFEKLNISIKQGLPTLGTCAGLILLSNLFKVLDVQVQRNAYGPQIESFETQINLVGYKKTCQGFFIRAPKIIEVGNLAKPFALLDDGEVVGVTQGNLIGISFHPEVAKSPEIHEIFVELIHKRLK